MTSTKSYEVSERHGVGEMWSESRSRHTAKPPRDHLQSTRQLIDELDLLMERMLALPVEDPQEIAEAVEQIMPTVSATLTVLDSNLAEDTVADSSPLEVSYKTEPAPETVEAVSSLAEEIPTPTLAWSAPDPIDATPSSLSSKPQEIPSLFHSLDAQPKVSTIPVDPVPQSSSVLTAPPLSPRVWPFLSWRRLAMLPLEGVNLLFDAATYVVGPQGRWLRSNLARNVLGVVGIAFFVMAGGWLLKDLMGWSR